MKTPQISTMSEQALTHNIGQYLNSKIKESWISATMSLACTNAHTDCDTPSNVRFICTAFYTSEFHPETSTSIEDKPIEVSSFIQAVFEQLFINAQEKSGKTWAEAIYSVTRSGQFKLTFVDNDGEIR